MTNETYVKKRLMELLEINPHITQIILDNAEKDTAVADAVGMLLLRIAECESCQEQNAMMAENYPKIQPVYLVNNWKEIYGR